MCVVECGFDVGDWVFGVISGNVFGGFVFGFEGWVVE